MDVLGTVPVVQNPPEMQSSDEDESAKGTIERRTIPYAVEIAELFGELELLATECPSFRRSIASTVGKAHLSYGETQQTTNTEQPDVNCRVHADRWDDVTY